MTRQTRDMMLTIADWKLRQAIDFQGMADQVIQVWLDRKLELELEDVEHEMPATGQGG